MQQLCHGLHSFSVLLVDALHYLSSGPVLHSLHFGQVGMAGLLHALHALLPPSCQLSGLVLHPVSHSVEELLELILLGGMSCNNLLHFMELVVSHEVDGQLLLLVAASS